MESLSKKNILDTLEKSAGRQKDAPGNEPLIIVPMSESERSSLLLHYCFASGLYGEMLLAWSEQGLCFLGFTEDRETALRDLGSRFPKLQPKEGENEALVTTINHFLEGRKITPPILHLYGTSFQHTVWEYLITIPAGSLSSYGEIAAAIGKPKASRAVGTAVGSNPVSYLVPCHRVVRAGGELGGYHWGLDRKVEMLKRELGAGQE